METMIVQSIVVAVICTDLTLSAITLLGDKERDFFYAEICILGVLCLDIVCRLLAEGRAFWIGRSWTLNIFELAVVVVCVVIFAIQNESGEAPSTSLRLVGRILRLYRPFIIAFQQRTRFFKAARSTAQRKAFKIFQKLLGDIIRVDPSSVFVDPVEGSFTIFCAEVKTEEFEGIYGPLTVTGGFATEMHVRLPLLEASQGPQAKIRFHLKNTLILFGPVLPSEAGGWSFEHTCKGRSRLVELIYRRLEILAPVLIPLLGINSSKKPKLKDQSSKSLGGLRSKASKKNVFINDSAPLKSMDMRAQQRAFKERLKKKLLRSLLSNLEVEVQNIELRYEDIHKMQPEPFACGVKLGYLTFQSSREDELDEVAEHGSEDASGRLSPSRSLRAGLSSPMSCPSVNPSSTQNSHAFHMFAKSDMEIHLTIQNLAIERLSVFWDVEPSSSYTARYQNSPADLHRHFVVSGHWERLKLAAVAEIASNCSNKPHKQDLLQGPMFRERLDHHYYVVFPLNIYGHISRRHEAPWREPPVEVKIKVSAINVAIDNRQMHCFNHLYAHWRLWKIEDEVLQTRPLRSITDGPPTYKNAEPVKGEVVRDEDRHEHARCWWKHVVRSAQIRLNLRPRLISDDFKLSIVDELQAEYVDLIIQEKFQDRLLEDSRKANAERIKNVQVVLPLRVILRLRLVAKKRVKDVERSRRTNLGQFGGRGFSI
jgi:hypothetical protein